MGRIITFFEWLLSITLFTVRPIIGIFIFGLAKDLHSLTYRVLSNYSMIEDVGVVISLDVFAIIMIIIGICLVIPLTSSFIFSLILYTAGSKNYKSYLKFVKKYEYYNFIIMVARTITRKNLKRAGLKASSFVSNNH